jgi:hypothetical protein
MRQKLWRLARTDHIWLLEVPFECRCKVIASAHAHLSTGFPFETLEVVIVSTRGPFVSCVSSSDSLHIMHFVSFTSTFTQVVLRLGISRIAVVTPPARRAWF